MKRSKNGKRGEKVKREENGKCLKRRKWRCTKLAAKSVHTGLDQQLQCQQAMYKMWRMRKMLMMNSMEKMMMMVTLMEKMMMMVIVMEEKSDLAQRSSNGHG